MKRILSTAVALALAGAASIAPAWAQNCSGQPAANTVCAGPATGGAGLPGFRALVNADMPAGLPLLGNNNIWTGTNTFNPASGDAITINPAAASTAKGFNITQSGPVSTITGPFIYNSITINNPTTVVAPGTLTNGMLNAEVRGFHIEMNDPSNSTLAVASSVHMVTNSGTPTGDKVGFLSNVYSNKNINGFIMAIDAVSSVDTGGNINFLVGLGVETAFYGTGSATNRIALQITNDTSTQATAFDAAIAIDNAGTAAGAFKKGISFGSTSVVPSIDTAGDAIYVSGPMTIANFCNCSNFTVTNALFIFPNFSVININNQNAIAQASIGNSSGGTGAYAQWVATNGTNTAAFGMAGTAALPALYTGRGYATASGAAMVVGTTTSNPLIFAIGNAEAGRWDSVAPGKLIAGVAGTLVGNFCTANVTSGTICLAPPTGALGSAVLTLPDVTATLTALGNTSTGSGSVVLATAPTISSLTVTTAFTATGLVANASLVNASTTVNGQTCTLGAACTTTTASQSDYVASTWTPAITASGTAGTPAYSLQVGSYEKIGRQVTVRFAIILSGWTGSPAGNITITGLPLANGGGGGDGGRCFFSFWNVSSSTAGWAVTGEIAAGTSILTVYTANGNTTINMTAALLGTTPTLDGFCNYHT